MPTKIEMATATIEPSTLNAPFTPHIHAAASGDSRLTSRRPDGKKQPSSIDSGASRATTTALRAIRPDPIVACVTGWRAAEEQQQAGGGDERQRTLESRPSRHDTVGEHRCRARRTGSSRTA